MENKIQAAEMKFLRSTAEYKLLNRKRNDDNFNEKKKEYQHKR